MNAAASSWRTCTKRISSWRWRSASMMPLIPSPGRPNTSVMPQWISEQHTVQGEDRRQEDGDVPGRHEGSDAEVRCRRVREPRAEATQPEDDGIDDGDGDRPERPGSVEGDEQRNERHPGEHAVARGSERDHAEHAG